ncbi:hypothetical protein PMAYCL1PPCAC_25255, partial [Pristionchus mayeri]
SVNREADQAGMKNTPPDAIIRFDLDYASLQSKPSYVKESPEVEVKGVPWTADVEHNRGESSLRLTIFCNHEQSTPWNIDINAEFIVIHPDNNDDNISVEMSGKFRNLHVYGTLLPNMAKLFDMNNGFVKDEKVSVEVHIWISYMRGIRIARIIDFTDSNVPFHDLALIIEGEKIYVSKQILAANSPVFESMFYSDFAEKDMNEIQLNDVEQKDFIELLHLIYSPKATVKDDSVQRILKLADRFQVESVIERAEEYLIESEYFSNTMKLKIADEYRLFGLQDHSLSYFETKDQIKTIKMSPAYKNFSDSMKIVLLEKYYEITAD